MLKLKKGYFYQINLIPEKEGGYTVLVPQLPGRVSYGNSIEEATKFQAAGAQIPLELSGIIELQGVQAEAGSYCKLLTLDCSFLIPGT